METEVRMESKWGKKSYLHRETDPFLRLSFALHPLRMPGERARVCKHKLGYRMNTILTMLRDKHTTDGGVCVCVCVYV